MDYNFDDIYKSLSSISEAANEPYPTQSLDASCQSLRRAINNFFPDFTCRGVKYTANTDKQFFGIFVKPGGIPPSGLEKKVFKGFEYSTVDKDFEPFKYPSYVLELDGKLFRHFNLSPMELWAIIMREINVLNSIEPSIQLRNIIDAYIALNNIQIDLNIITAYGEVFDMVCSITLHNITSMFAKFDFSFTGDVPDIITGYDLGPAYRSALQKFSEAGATPDTYDTSTVLLSWYFSVYKNLHENRNVEYMLRDSIATEASSLVRSMTLAALKSVSRITDFDNKYLSTSVNEATKRKGLIYQMKRNGLKSIEEDLFEYNMRLRNVETQDDAILLMRQINSRMGILEDYLREEEIDDQDKKRWEDCYKKYLELREDLSKKTVYNKKMYGLFVDYNALQNMSQSGQLMNTYY